MTVVLATIAVTAIVVAAIAARVTQQRTLAAVQRSIGGRAGLHPADEHHRMLQAAQRETRRVTQQLLLMQGALDALTLGVVVGDKTGAVVVENIVAGSITARPHEQALVDAAVAELLATAVRGEREERQIDVFGPPSRSLLVRAAPIAVDDEPIGGVVAIDDVSEQHRIENSRRDFVANLSHELRTPVGAVSLLGEMLVGEGDPDVQKQLTDRLMIEVDRISATVDDLLELSRIESSTQSYDELLPVQDLVAEALARTRVAAETSGVNVSAVAPDTPVEIRGNADQMVTALVNLVENAIKYSNPGDSVVARTSVDDGEVAVAVQDTGRGIPARDLDRIFERFHRVDRARDSTTGGTGIGLSIVRHVALNHGGRVEVTSYEGDGSTFTITVPRPSGIEATPTRERAHS